jgi:phosphoglycolate phosphatase
MKQKLIIWDWNGTLLNDVDACVNAMNSMLVCRNRKTIDKKTYLNIFTFPVRNYYKSLGFDFSEKSFEDLSVEYIDLYSEYSKSAPLQNGAVDALEVFKNKGYKQIIVSASEQKSLEYQVEERQIVDYFDSILGLDNIYAHSKLDNALLFIEKAGISTNQAVFIGDTYHDYEVASAIGCNCILVRNGHQNLNRFNMNGSVKIIESLTELYESTI